jgi:hypothetical protein
MNECQRICMTHLRSQRTGTVDGHVHVAVHIEVDCISVEISRLCVDDD